MKTAEPPTKTPDADRRAAASTARLARSKSSAELLPNFSPWWFKYFSGYVRWYVRRNFHALRITKQGYPVVPPNRPLIIYLNHPGWWDPLAGMAIGSLLFAGRKHYAAIDDAALKKYRIFEKVGFFGIEPGSTRGGIKFLRTAQAILSQPESILWITPEGEFVDPRQRPVQLQPGLSRLIARSQGAVVLPLALEYTFWQERFPEGLAHFGSPIDIDEFVNDSADCWHARLTAAMSDAQDALAAKAIGRRPEDFEILLRGSAGVGGLYDVCRRIKCFLCGEKFHAQHGDDA